MENVISKVTWLLSFYVLFVQLFEKSLTFKEREFKASKKEVFSGLGQL